MRELTSVVNGLRNTSLMFLCLVTLSLPAHAKDLCRVGTNQRV